MQSSNCEETSNVNMRLEGVNHTHTQSETVRRIVTLVAAHYEVLPADVFGRCRSKTIAEARSTAMWISRQLTERSLCELGRDFGRDHSTVRCSLDTVETRMALWPRYQEKATQLLKTAQAVLGGEL